jgi:DNA/RNA-binding domain of Phe-tRNA-synthetase-like protein
VEAETQRVWLVGVRVPGVDVEVVEHALLEAVHALSTSFGLRLEAHAHQEPEVSV